MNAVNAENAENAENAMLQRARRIGGRALRLLGRRPVTERMLRRVRAAVGEAPVIVEAGAHDGADTVRLHAAFAHPVIHAFEPVPSLFERLARRTGALPEIHCHNMALAGSAGPKSLYVSGGASDGSSSLLRPQRHLDVHPGVTFNATINVKTTTLDDWSAANNVPRVDFLWLDLQGAEYDVLSASPKCLDTARAIYTEVSLLPMYEGTPLYGEFRQWLESKGFRVVIEDLRWQDMGNVLLVR